MFSTELSTRSCDGYAVVALRGELDLADAADVAAELTAVAAREPGIIVDLAGLRVLIVDDNPALRREIRRQLESAGLEVCGEASDGIEGLENAREVRPDLVILDVAMPRLNGIDAARELRKVQPKLPVILHTLHADIIRSQGLPEGVSEVVAKGEPLIPVVLTLLDAPRQ